MLGDKTNGGFFKRDRGRALTLDLQKFEYRMRREANFPSLEVAKKIKSVSERLPTLVYADDRAGAYLWRTLSETLVYAANRVPEIVDTIVEIDNAMKWGFGHELGIFEMWDAIGLERSVSHIRAEGRPIPINVEQMLAAGYKSFYKSEHDARRYFDFQKGEYRLGSESPGTGGIKLIKKIDV
jgi:3-hydroxyacyl-CoA dehydrogenase